MMMVSAFSTTAQPEIEVAVIPMLSRRLFVAQPADFVRCNKSSAISRTPVVPPRSYNGSP
jgi:hypothetical protein